MSTLAPPQPKPKAKARAKGSALQKALAESGRPLPEALRIDLEIKFSADLRGVRVHTGPLADEVAREMGAEALTFGKHIFFRAGTWQPETPSGRDLLAHEAAHTLQQEAATTAPVEAPPSEPGDAVERSAVEATETDTAPAPEAEAVAARRVAGIAPREKRTIDPARTVEELARTLILRVRSDTQDSSGRIRNQLIRMDDDLRRDVLRWMEAHMESHEWRDFVDVLAQDVPPGLDGTEDAQAVAKAGLPEETPGAPDSREATPGTGESSDKEQTEADEPKTPAGQVSDEAAEGAETAAGEPAEAAVAQPALEGGKLGETGEGGPAAAGGGPAPEAAQAGGSAAAAAAASSAAPPAMDQPAVAEPAEAEDTDAAPGRDEARAGRGSSAAETAVDPAETSETEPQTADTAMPEPGSSSSEEEAATGSASGSEATAESEASPEASTAEPDTAAASEADEAKAAAPEGGSAPEAEAPSAGTGEAPAGSPAEASVAAEPVTPSAAEPAAPEQSPALDADPSSQPSASGEAAGVEAATVPQAEELPEQTAPSATEEQPVASAAAGESAEAETAPGSEATAPGEPSGAGGATEIPAPAASGEAGAPGAIPPGLLGEFAGEPQETEAAAPSGGGGGGAAVPEPPPEPDAGDSIPAGDPVGAMEAVGTMKVAAAAQAMGSATATVAAQSSKQQGDLAAAPPTVERPTGAPQGADGFAPGQVPAPPAMDPLKRPAAVAAGAPVPLPPVPGAPEPGAPVTQGIARPQVTGTAEGKITEADARRVREAVDDVPVTDDALNVSVEEAPEVPLEGDADPVHVQQQQGAIMESAATNAAQGAQDAAKPMGEDHLYPVVTPGIIRPDASAASGGAAVAGPVAAAEGGAGGPIDIGVATVAEQEHGDEVRQGATGAAGKLTTEQQKQVTEQKDANAASQKKVNDAIAANASEQREERTSTRRAVLEQRKQWTEGQKNAVDAASKGSDAAVLDAGKDIDQERTAAHTKAAGHVAEGNRQITEKRRESEREAREKKEKAKRESEDDGGILGWIASSITSFFNKLMDAVHAVFDAARKFVKTAIEAVQKLVHEVIDAARRAVVGLIKAAGAALLAISDTLLAAFPALRDKFHKAIQKAVDGAVKAVNDLAAALEKGINALLNGLMTVLNAIIAAYEAIYSGIIKAVAGLVKGVLDKVRSVIAALAAFASLVKDIAPAPGQWLSNLGSSIMDGLKNHLWTALKLAFKTWFNDTIEGIIGMGKMVLDVLRKGGLSLKKIAGFVWSAIISAIPGIVIQFLIEKLIAMLIPAAGAVMLIVQGLIAAWGAVQRIIAAFQMFLVFLKAVKNGNAGPQFATALAASAIALIQFLAGFLMARLGGAASGVTGKLKAIAQKIMAFFKKVGKAIGKGLKVVGRVIVKGAKAVGRLVVKGAKAVGRVVVRGAKAVARVAKRAAKAVVRVLRKTKVGRAILRAGRKVIDKVRGGIKKFKGWVKKKRDQFKEWREKRKAKAAERKKKRLSDAVAAIQGPLEAMLARGVGGWWLKARLGFWRLRYRLSSLRIVGHEIIAKVNPEAPVVAVDPEVQVGRELEPILLAVEEAFTSHYYSSRAADDLGARDQVGQGYIPRNAEVEDVLRARRGRTGEEGLRRHQPLEFDSAPAPIRSPNEKRYRKKAAERHGMSDPVLLSGYKVGNSQEASYAAMEKGWTARGLPTMAQLANDPQYVDQRALRLLERARGEGMLPAMDLAQSLAEAGHADAGEVTYGALAPMAPLHAAKATEVDAARTLITGPEDPDKVKEPAPQQPKYKDSDLATARDERHRRIANIFNRLRSILRTPQPIATTPGNTSFPKLGQAFERWLKARATDDKVEKQGAAEELAGELLIFLRSYRGG